MMESPVSSVVWIIIQIRQISQSKYESHAHLISRRFEIKDFIYDEDFHKEWVKQRGRLDPDIEKAIANAFLCDHIAPIRADTEEMLGISGNALRRYRLVVPINVERPYIQMVHKKSAWPSVVIEIFSKVMIQLDKGEWSSFSENEMPNELKRLGAHTMAELKYQAEKELYDRIPFKSRAEYDALIKHVRKQMKLDSRYVIAGHGKGVRYAMFLE